MTESATRRTVHSRLWAGGRGRLFGIAVTVAGFAFVAASCQRRPRAAATWQVTITDGEGGPAIGGHILLSTEDGQSLRIGTIDLYEKRQTRNYCVIAPGVVGTWDGLVVATGRADIPIGGDNCKPSPAIRPGRYRVLAWRGIEHDSWHGEVDLRSNTSTVIALRRVWQPRGALVADLHVHAEASGDSLVAGRTRVMAQVAAGIEVIGLSDHNHSGDLDAEIRDLGLESVVTSIASNELTAEPLHLGVYPVPVAKGEKFGGGPDPSRVVAASIPQLFDIADEFPGDPIVQVNHPRFRVTALFDSAGWNGTSWPPPFPLRFDAFEVLSGHTVFNIDGDRRIDDSLRDLYTFVDRGHPVAALGNSDTHHLNGVRDGLARNYVFVDSARIAPFDEAGFIAAVKSRRLMVSSGPILDVMVRTGPVGEPSTREAGTGEFLHAACNGNAVVDIGILQADFVRADRLRVWVGRDDGPAKVEIIDLEKGDSQHSITVPIEQNDTWIGVDVVGSDPLPPEITGTYQLEKGRPGTMPAAFINPILVDCDGDGVWRRGGRDLPVAKPQR